MVFGTTWGLFQFRRMPFGLLWAAASFQCLMNQLLDPHQEYTAAYIDDIIIFSNDWKTHCQHLREILNELRQARLTANPWKCALGKETQYLGFMVRQEEIKPVADKVAAIR